jgi:hypothetical protein
MVPSTPCRQIWSNPTIAGHCTSHGARTRPAGNTVGTYKRRKKKKEKKVPHTS